MKVLLIDPPGWQKHSVNLGLAYLAGTLASEKIEVKILDLNNHPCSDDALRDTIKAIDPGIIGISIKTATANASSRIADTIKKSFPHLPLVAGGPHISLCSEEFLRENRSFDFGIVGDGEVPLAALTRSLTHHETDLGHVRGLCYHRNGTFVRNASGVGSEITRLAYPDFDPIVDMDFQDFRYPLLTSRGCPYGCIFCCVGAISGKKWRPREPEDVVGELIAAKQKYQITSFEIMDDNCTFDVARAKALCRLLIKKKLRLDWWCHNGVRADKLDRELLRLMKRAGCRSIAIGVETGDENVFKGINKGETLADITRAVKMIQGAGLQCVGYFIVGLPGDSVASTKKTVRFQRSLNLSHFTYNIAIPYPGTKMADLVQKNGRLLLDIKETYHFGENAKVPFETDQLSQETIKQCFQLANHQGWVWGERDLQRIREMFKARYRRDVQRVAFIADRDAEGISKNIQIEYGQAKVLEIKVDESLRSLDNNHLVALRETHGYFDEVFGLFREGGEIIANMGSQKLFFRDNTKRKEEYVRDEKLPDIREWDKPEGKYYAARLKHFSPDSCLRKNGIIYKDGIALPFNAVPQWQKVACGKIQSGLVFISLAAHDLASQYTADYVATNLGVFTKELVLDNPASQGGKTDGIPRSILDTVLAQTDMLFVPGSLAGYAHIFSKAKMNVVYSKKNSETLALGYETLESFAVASASLSGTLRTYLGGRIEAAVRTISLTRTVARGIILWVQIIIMMSWTGIKSFSSRIVRISR